MWRVLFYFAVIAVLAFGAVWLSEQPGGVSIVVGGVSYSTTLIVAVLALGALIAAVLLLWTLGNGILRLPNRISKASVDRHRRKGLTALSRGMIAVGAGDDVAARRYASEAQRHLKAREPMVMLLKAQAAQISGDRETAEATFRAMTEDEGTRVLGLRGLYVEARRRGDAASAWSHATEAARLAPAASWASDAVMEAQCARGEWRTALEAVERRSSLGLVDKAVSRRQRAVLLTAEALSRGETDEDGALRAAREAVRLAPDLVPAAALAGRILGRRMELRRAAKILETAWKACPHPDLAEVYTHLRQGDSAGDRLQRAERLARLSSWDPEGRMVLARAAVEARDFALARNTIAPLLAERPSVRVCLLMAELERAEHGATGRQREWLARAVHAPRDKAWIADGIVSERWSPVSPVSGQLDAFTWQTPPDLIAGAGSTVVDDIVADLDDRPTEPVALPGRAERPQTVIPPRDEPATAPAAAPLEPVTTSADAPVAAGPERAPEPSRPVVSEPAPVGPASTPATTPPASQDTASPPEGPAPAHPPVTTEQTVANTPAPRGDGADPSAGPTRSAPDKARAEPDLVVPVTHPPDDPGTERTAEPQRNLFRLFG